MPKIKTISVIKESDLEDKLSMFGGLNDLEAYFPEKYNKLLPKEGAWIQVIYPPNTSVYVEYLGIYYAVPKESSEINFIKYMVINEDNLVQERFTNFAKILTPDGEVCLYPYEYTKIDNIYNYLGAQDSEKEIIINWLSPRNENFDTDILHYITSRGIPPQKAWEIILGEVKNQTVCYLTFSKWIQELFAGTGVASLNARSNILDHINKKRLTKEEIAQKLKDEELYTKQAKEKEKEKKALAAVQKKAFKSWKFPFRTK